MHELSIAQEILNIVSSNLPDGNTKVKSVRVKVGKLSGVLSDSLKFCFESIVYQTEFDGAVLEIIDVPIKIKCNECETESIINDPIFCCPKCNSFNVQLLEGKELQITEIEIDEREKT